MQKIDPVAGPGKPVSETAADIRVSQPADARIEFKSTTVTATRISVYRNLPRRSSRLPRRGQRLPESRPPVMIAHDAKDNAVSLV